jgi:RNA polymerase sigma-70 factor (ECF subfamily)
VGEEDQNLVRVAQWGAGPEAHRAFAALLHRWQAPVHRFVRSRIRDEHDAEETTADAFVEAWKSLHNLKDPNGFRPWLFRIAWTRVLRWYEARGVRAMLTPVELDILEEQTASAPVQVQEELREALASLASADLHLLLDKYESRLSYKDIAERDGISVSTVRDRLVAARDRLSKVLQRAGVFDEFAREMEERRRRRHPGKAGFDRE